MTSSTHDQRNGSAKADATLPNAEQDTLTPAWRQLPFYEVSQVRDATDFARGPSIFRSSALITAVEPTDTCPAFVNESLQQQQHDNGDQGSSSATATTLSNQSSNIVLIGQSNGQIAVCQASNYKVLGQWSAFYDAGADVGHAALTGRVTHVSCDTAGRAITLGEDGGARFPILRIWDLRTTGKPGNNNPSPRLLAESKVQHGSKPFPVASIAHSPSSAFLAIGLGDGTVLLLRALKESLEIGATAKSNAASPTVILPKFKVIHQASTRPGEAGFMDTVTGLGFAEQAVNYDITPSQAQKSRQAGPAPRKPRNRIPHTTDIVADHASAVNGTSVRESHGTVHLFIVTLSRILRYTVLGKGAGTPASVVDDVGCALNCAVIIPSEANTKSHSASPSAEAEKLTGRMIIARDEAIYVVGTEGREMTFAFEGPKSSIRLCDTQLIIVSPPMAASAASASATVRHHVSEKEQKHLNGARDLANRNKEVAKATVFDLESKLVAYSGTFDGGIQEAWADAEGGISILCDDGTLMRFDEKTLKQKLDILFRKSLYLLAINVARSHINRSRTKSSVDPGSSMDPLLGDIHRKYGDYLYEKGDFEGAVGQFVKTIGVTQPSYVIRKFLDAQRITNLTTYLQELHAQGLANADHTTLLLNCFAKLKDVASLDRFIKRPIEKPAHRNGHDTDDVQDEDEEDGAFDQDELPFDLDTAIRVCRQGGYFQHAAYLAQRYGQTDENVRIQIEDLSDYSAATQYIRSLPIDDAQRNLLRYGRKMLDHDPTAATDLLIELCSGAFQPVPIAVGAGVDAGRVESKQGYMSYLNVGRLGRPSQQAEQDGQRAISGASKTSDDMRAPTIAPASTEQAVKATPPSSRIFFAHFIEHQVQFVRFLETVALARWGQSINEDADAQREKTIEPREDAAAQEDDDMLDEDVREQRTIWNTLLELYLSLSHRLRSDQEAGVNETSKAETKGDSDYRSRALQLLRSYQSLPYDVGQALIICTQYHFTEGIVLLYERKGMYEDILRLYMERDDELLQGGKMTDAHSECAKTLAALERYAMYESDLNALVLRHLVSTEQRLLQHQADVERILTRIFEEQLLSPLEVVQLLSKNGVATIGLLREHLMRALEAQQSDIVTNATLTRAYREETRVKEAEIAELQNVEQPRIFQQSKCSACGGTLDLPSVHFMCRHSFHGRCLGEGENECPLCAQSHGVILEIRRNNVQFGQRHDLFLDEVEDAEDGFDVVAGMFSKGLFGAQQLEEQRDPQ